MASLTPKTIARAYLIIVFLLAVLASPLPQSAVALILLIGQLYAVYKPLKTGLSLTLTIGTLVFTPLSLEPLTGNLFACLFTTPALYLLDQNLKDNASNQQLNQPKKGKKPTPTLNALATALLLTCAASVLLWNQTLMLTTAILVSYLAVVLCYTFIEVPKTPVEESKTRIRVLVGDTTNQSMLLYGRANLPLSVTLESQDPWIQGEPSKLILPAHSQVEVGLKFTPPLAGLSIPQIQATSVDPWGLMQINQKLEPAELHIIPRAKYAQWLAKKFLEQTASGTAPTTFFPSGALRHARRGVEYKGSRMFQPGDRLKDVDWKHSFMLNELVLKEFAGFQGQPVIIAADLTARDTNEADRLAFNFVMTALTLAVEALPTTLAVYNHKEVLAATLPANPREMLKKTLKLSGSITLVEPSERVLQSAEFWRLKRSMSQLEKMETESAQSLLEILQIEHQASQKTANDQPASWALAKAVERTPPPALIAVVSSVSQDSDVLATVLWKLKEKGYGTVQVGTGQRRR
jgi:uncharacterized protein (DUF58 family)